MMVAFCTNSFIFLVSSSVGGLVNGRGGAVQLLATWQAKIVVQLRAWLWRTGMERNTIKKCSVAWYEVVQ